LAPLAIVLAVLYGTPAASATLPWLPAVIQTESVIAETFKVTTQVCGVDKTVENVLKTKTSGSVKFVLDGSANVCKDLMYVINPINQIHAIVSDFNPTKPQKQPVKSKKNK
jgi:hypothetical protein